MDKFNPSFSSTVSPDLALLNKIDFLNCVKATTSCFQHNLLPPYCSEIDFFLKQYGSSTGLNQASNCLKCLLNQAFRSVPSIPVLIVSLICAGIFKLSMEARNRV